MSKSRITRKGQHISKENLLRRVMGPTTRAVHIKFLGIRGTKALLYRSGDQYHFVLEILPRNYLTKEKTWPSEKPTGDVTDIYSGDELKLDVTRMIEISD